VLVPVDADLAAPRAVSCRRGVETIGGETMGTAWSVRMLAPFPARDLIEPVERVLARIIAQMSTWEPQSGISRFNRADAGTWHRLAPEFAAVLKCALALAGQTGGAYDPAAGALVDLWGFGAPGARTSLPDPAAVAAARARCGWQRIRFEAAPARIFQPGGVALDLSSIAKGYAVDAVARLLKSAGVESFLVEIGGELRGEGVKPGGLPWWVELERPPSRVAGGSAAEETVVALCGLSVATSGACQRFFSVDGRSYSHTIDPRSGYPVPHELLSVTVLHPECMLADALATALTVLGPDEGLAFAAREDIAAAFLCDGPDGLRESLSPKFAAMLD
jgi:thiamine biosynthesis lipoprotein